MRDCEAQRVTGNLLEPEISVTTTSSRVRLGRNSYRNLVSCCMECNFRKNDRPARDFLRTLYRQGRLTSAELDARLRALKNLGPGRLRPIPPISAG